MAEVAQTFSVDPYAAQQAQLARQQKLAEILQSQALAPDAKYSYAGIEAPPSAAAALAKGLQSGISGYLMGRSMKGQEDLIRKSSADTTDATKALIEGLTPRAAVPGSKETLGAVAATGADAADRDLENVFAKPTDNAPPVAIGQQLAVPGGMGEGANIGTPGGVGAAPATPGGYAGALASLGAMKDNPQAQRLAQALTMKKIEQDMAQTKLGPGEAVFNSGGQKLFGQDPAAKFGTTPQNIARDQNSPTGWSGMIIDGSTGAQRSIPVNPPRDMTDLTLNERVNAGNRGAEIAQGGQRLNYETGMSPAMPPAVQGAPVPQAPNAAAPSQGAPSQVPNATVPPQGALPVPRVGAPGPMPVPNTVSPENPLIKNVAPKEAQKLLLEQPQAKQAATVITATIDQHIKQIDDLLGQKGFNDIFGTINSKTMNISEKAGNAQSAFDAVAGQSAVQALNEMRAASKTGGAVGNVTEKEWPILQSQMAALGQSQGPDEMRKNLKNLKETYGRIKDNASKAYSATYGADAAGGNSVDDLLAKYGAM